MSFLSGLRGGTDVGFDGYDEFVPDHLPEPGPFLTDADVLTGTDHAALHRLTMDLFDERGVYDMTFGYNLAQLNLDQRHPDSGFRYAREADGKVLRAAFTPTTEFCPQSDTLTVGAFRAWNGLSDRHEYDVVRVRVDAMHHQSEAINERLRDLEARYRETGAVDPDEHETDAVGSETGVDATDDVPF
ncbi:hypothetical protein [Haloarcula salina]|uniref:DUF7998 domain-containing protein n=1 Tax=Haloarcula salina TaxID=1429914 RepID=A0AA41G831_9EURY|nr:hypothetical protein [Haloarcula salina]MBV0901882.1 hypothetical protein [Haloarcula salina]